MRWQLLIEYSCPNCGCGFSSPTFDAHFCSRGCALEYRGCSNATKQKLSRIAKNQWAADRPKLISALAGRDTNKTSEHARLLWQDPNFKQKIIAARKSAGYPDKNRPEAVAKRKLYTAAKNAVHRCIRGQGALRLVGYTLAELKACIESKFQPGMSWANYGKWEIDHIFPISKFPPKAPISVINALSNLQPLWKTDNRKKHAHVSL